MWTNAKHLLATVLAFAVLTGCATNPITGRSQLVLVSGEEAVASSYQAYSAMTANLQQQSKINRDAGKLARIRAITGRLIPHALAYRSDAERWKWEVNVIDSPEVNAFCMAGGKMAIYSGFFDHMNPSDDELAQVMAHEIAHALSDHTREKMSVAMASDLGVQLLASGAQASAGQTQMAHALALYVIQMPNSRTAENEADRIGIELAARAGYNPEAAITLWQKMSRQGDGPPEWLSTHPSHESRIAELSRMAPRVEPLYRDAKGRPQKSYHF